MLYPFFDDLKKMNEEEIYSKLEKLRHRLVNYGRHNDQAAHQLQLMIETLQDQLATRQYEKEKEKNKNKPINDPIDIG